MTTWTQTITDGANDGHTNADGSTTNLTSTLTSITTGTALWRFTDAPVPQGAQITSATATLTTQTTGSGQLTLRAAAADHVPALTGALATAARTSAFTAYSSPSGAQTNAYDVTAIIKELVDRPGWATGNALALTLARDSGTVAARFIEGGAQYAATLVIEYEVGPPPGARLMELTATTVGSQPAVRLLELEAFTDAPDVTPGAGRVWLGDQWATVGPRYWSGSQWVPPIPHAWSGSQWTPTSM